MKKLSLFLIITIFTLASYSQSVQWMSPVQSLGNRESVPVIIGADENTYTTRTIIENAGFTYYAYADVTKGIRFDKYDAETNELILSKTHMYEDEHYVFKSTFIRGDEILILNYYFLGRDEKFVTRFFIYDLKTFEFKESKNLFEREAKSALYNREILLDYSENKKQILLSESIVSMKDIKYLTRLYDENWNLRYTDTLINRSYLQIDNEGSIYYLRRESETENYIVSHDINRDFEKWEERINLSVLEEDEVMTHMTTTLNPGGDLIITGLYGYDGKKSDKKEKEQNNENVAQIKGYMFLKVDVISKEITEIKKTEFAKEKNAVAAIDDTFLEYVGEKDRSSIGTKVYPCNDGGTLFICEEQRKLEGGENTSTKYYYNDFFLFKIDNTGTLKWVLPVLKNQEYKFRTSQNYKVLQSNDRIYLLYYSDNTEKIKKDSPYKNSIGKNNFYFYEINSKTGELTLTPLFEEMQFRSIVRFVDFNQDNLIDEKYIIPFQTKDFGKTKYQIIKLKLN